MARYDQALAALDAGDLATAKTLLSAVILSAPGLLGARLDLALAACQSGHGALRDSTLDDLALSAGPGLPTGISVLMRQLREMRCDTRQHEARAGMVWQAGVASGITSNANLGPTSRDIATALPGFPTLMLNAASRPQADGYLQGAVQVEHRLDDTWQLRGQYVGRRHVDTHRVDADFLLLSGIRALDLERQLTVSLGDVRLDNRNQQVFLAASYQDRHQDVRVSHARRQDLPGVSEWRLGWLWRQRGDWSSAAWRVGAGPLADLSSRRPGGNRLGGELSAEVFKPLSHWLLSGQLGVQALWDDAPYSVVFGSTRRRALQEQLTLRAQWLPARWRPYVGLTVLRQQDRIDLFDFSAISLEVGLQPGG